MKKLIIFVIAALLAAAALNPAFAGEGEGTATLFIYITGSNLESGGGAATQDIMEMLHSGVDTNRVNVLLMTGGSKKWWGGFPDDQLCIYRISDSRLEPLQQMEKASMGEPETLTQFLNYGCELYPAERYALILWDHGGGPLEGVCYDELYNTDSLSMSELREALEASRFGDARQLEWIGFDACLMASVETAYTCSPYARYMIASQETEPGSGWDYRFLNGLEDGFDGAEAGRRIVDAYIDAAEQEAGEGRTLACIDLKKISPIEEAMDALFGELDSIIDPNSFSMLSNHRRDAKSFGRASTGSDYDLVDLHHLGAQYAQIAPEAAENLLSSIESAVTYRRGNTPDSNGLSVYYPYYNKDYYKSTWSNVFSDLGFSEGYTKYLKDYASLWLGETLSDWTDLRVQSAPREDAGSQELTLELTPDQAEHYAYSELYILGEFGEDNAYYDLYHLNDVALADGALSARYEYQALYAVDGDGNILTDALTYIRRDDTYLVRAALSHLDGEADLFYWLEDDPVVVYLQCKPMEGTDELQVVGVIEIPEAHPLSYISDENVLLHGKQTLTLDPSEWAWIQFVRQPKVRTTTGDGSTSPFTDWPYSNEIVEGSLITEYYSVDNREPWTLKFCREQDSGRSLWAQYVITDTQGGRFASDLLPIENPNVVDRRELNQTIVDSDDLEVTLTAIEAIDVHSAVGASVRFGTTSFAMETTGNEAGLYLRAQITNRSQKLAYFSMDRIVFDQTAIHYSIRINDPLSEETQVLFFIPNTELPPLADARFHSLQFELAYYLGNYESENTVRVPARIEAEIELGNLAIPLPQSEPIALAVDGDVSYELLNLREEGDSLLADLHIINGNPTALEREYSVSCDYAVNGCFIRGGCRADDIVVPGGAELYAQIQFWGSNDELTDSLEDHSYFGDMASEYLDANPIATRGSSDQNGFKYWGIHEIDSLELFGLFGEEKIIFRLNEPFGLSKHSAPVEEVPMFSEDGISMFLHEAEVVDDELRLYVTVRSEAEREVEFGLGGALVNGEDDGISYCSLEGENMGAGFTNVFAPGLSCRGTITISFSSIVRDLRLEDIRLNACYNGGDYWQYLSEIVIAPKESCTFQKLADAPMQANGFRITAGKADHLPNVAVDPITLFEAELDMPENASQYAVALGAQLTPEQAESFQSARMYLFTKEDGYDRFFYFKDAELQLGEGGKLLAEFDGLAPYVSGESLPLVTHETKRNGQSLSLYAAGIGMEARFYVLDDLHFNAVHIDVDAQANSAHISGIDLQRELYSHEKFSLGMYLCSERLPTYNEDGSLGHFDNWDSGGIRGPYFDIDDGGIELEIRPVISLDAYVLFSINNRDGSSYSLQPIPYEEAIMN